MTTEKINRQYGLWDSPMRAANIGRSVEFNDVAWDQDGTLVWLERRSDRGVLVVQPSDGQAPRDLNSHFSIRARVGYGGGDFTLGNGYAYFSDADSGRIYRQPLKSGAAQPITPAFGFSASPLISPDGRWLAYIHTYEAQDSLAIVDTEGKFWPARLASGSDFYMQPRWHPSGHSIAWVEWNHPNMPWDGTLLRLGKFAMPGRAGAQQSSNHLPELVDTTSLAGGEEISIFQPEFSPDGRSLAYISDKSGWWQLYLYDLDSGVHRPLTDAPAEHGSPAWIQGIRNYGFSPDGKQIYFLRNDQGFVSLWMIQLDSGKSSHPNQERLPLDPAYTWLNQLAVSPSGNSLALIASGVSIPSRVITFEPTGRTRIVRRGTSEEAPQSLYPPCKPIDWTGMDGGTAYGLYYPPCNDKFYSNGKPPLIVHIHGGPTSQASAANNPRATFFTSRGYAVLEVNHRGSTGYGREYRNALRKNWGIYDVQDSVSGAKHLVDQGLVDASRLVIMGGSAGGYTVLKTLEDFPGFFKAGICLYGVSNMFTLAAETHKFEAHYTDSMIGPLPESADLYHERSPIFFVDKIQDPIAIFQGEVDQVVPRSQSDTVVESLKQRGIPYEYHLYPGEGHGFRRTETIEAFYTAVERFLKQYVIFA